MRLSGTKTGELLDAVAARCERLVTCSVREPARARCPLAAPDRRRAGGAIRCSPLRQPILLPPLAGAPVMLAGVSARSSARLS